MVIPPFMVQIRICVILLINSGENPYALLINYQSINALKKSWRLLFNLNLLIKLEKLG